VPCRTAAVHGPPRSAIFCAMSSGLPAWVTSQAQLAVENMFLRKQQALYQERFVKPRRSDPETRVVLVLLSRLLEWRSLLTVVQPDTLIRWHRQAGGVPARGNTLCSVPSLRNRDVESVTNTSPARIDNG
jgi:hypothetical protein